jgi:hypothetical protein
LSVDVCSRRATDGDDCSDHLDGRSVTEGTISTKCAAVRMRSNGTGLVESTSPRVVSLPLPPKRGGFLPGAAPFQRRAPATAQSQIPCGLCVIHRGVFGSGLQGHNEGTSTGGGYVPRAGIPADRQNQLPDDSYQLLDWTGWGQGHRSRGRLP